MSEQKNEPNISISAQYIKDLSFENKATPGTIEITSAPSIDLRLDINVTKVSEENYFEVALHINAKAMHEKDTLFIIELVYAGIFHLDQGSEEEQKKLLSVNCAALLFPYARKIIADNTQDGGFQPLMMDPINFEKLYTQRMAEDDSEDDNTSTATNSTSSSSRQ